jgi:type IV secretion system protein VirB4
MFNLFNKETEENGLTLEAPVPNFIPYACHYNNNTILTKNGELLQTIKIVGFTYETLGGVSLGLRDTVRKAVLERIRSSNLALTFHTVRRKHSLDTHPTFPLFFAQKLHEQWVRKNSWDDKYINELYLTVIHSGLSLKLNSSDTVKYFISNKLYQDHIDYLDEAYKDLDKTVLSLLEALSHYGAIRLGLVLHPDLGYTSDLLKFFSKIIHLEENDMPVPMADLSRYLAKYKIAFGNNSLEVRKSNGKFFGSILSVKAYHDVSAAVIDKFLQLPQQFVVTQTINFINKKAALKDFLYQNYILDVSGDTEFKQVIGLDTLLDNSKTSQVDYCESQLTIMVIADNLIELEQRIKDAAKVLFDIGLPVVREDLNLEHCFWSQLPGNFSYITRSSPMSTSIIAGMASLHNFPVGSLTSKWGEAITLLKTALGTPYFFNFHVGDIGHTIIVGHDGSGKVTLMNFLLSESLKLRPNVLYLDIQMESEIFIKALSGKYLTFSVKPTENAIRFNPLLLEDTLRNREFLRYWLLYLMDKYVDNEQLEEYTAAVTAAVDIIYGLPVKDRRLSNAGNFFNLPAFTEINKSILKKLSKWYGKGKYAHIFDNDHDDLTYSNNILAINMFDIVDTDIAFNLPIMFYLIHFFRVNFVGERSILVVAGCNRLFGNLYFEKNLPAILDGLTADNSILLGCASFSRRNVTVSDIIGQVYQDKMATKIFLPDETSYTNLKRVFKLSEQESMYLEALESSKRQFIIRQSDVSIISEMNLKGMDLELAILACSSEEDKQKLRDIIATYGEANDAWIRKLYELQSK